MSHMRPQSEPPIGVPEALERVAREIDPLPPRMCDLRHAAGRILASEVHAPHDSPPFDTSAMDGFAVRAADLSSATASHPVELPIHAEVLAGGSASLSLPPGRAIRINTGAPLPLGADAIVRVEDAAIDGASARFGAPLPSGANVRRAGEDYPRGRLLLPPGTRLDPTAIGLLASLGLARVPVARSPRVALLTSGDELVEPGNPIAFGQIYNSTRYALIPMLNGWGAEVHDLGSVADTPEAAREALARGLKFDVLVTTGGVSMGSRDLIRPTLIELGARPLFWKVRQRPGLPMFVAKLDREAEPDAPRSTLCFGLPGNPVSVFVTAMIHARRALLAMQGARDVEPPWSRAVAGAPFGGSGGLTVYARAEMIAGGEAREDPGSLPRILPSAAQGSHQFSALSAAAGLARLPENRGDLAEGEIVDFLDFRLAL
jgi:molybdopterin molybdotransferase